MNVRTLCLAILNCGESTGYEIRKLSTDGHYSHFVDASYGSIYPALNKLEDEQLVESREEMQPGKPSRKVYTITDAGRREFLEALGKPIQKDIFKSQFLLVCMFAEHLTRAQLSRVIDQQIANLNAELETIDVAEEVVDLSAAHWVANYGRTCLQASLDHLTRNRAALEAIAGSRHPASDQQLIAAE